jgi:hypothetical protein
MNLVGPLNSGAAVGGDGVATANETSTVYIVGRGQGIYVKHNGSPPAGTTDVTIATAGTSAPAYNLLAIVNAATDGWFYPRVQVHTVAGAAIAGEYTPLIVYDKLKVTIAQANAADSVDVWILLDDYSTEQ